MIDYSPQLSSKNDLQSVPLTMNPPQPTPSVTRSITDAFSSRSAAAVLGVLGVISALYFLVPSFLPQQTAAEDESSPHEHHLIHENSKYITVRGKRLRVVYIEHKLEQKVPLILFVHGVGSQVHFDFVPCAPRPKLYIPDVGNSLIINGRSDVGNIN